MGSSNSKKEPVREHGSFISAKPWVKTTTQYSTQLAPISRTERFQPSVGIGDNINKISNHKLWLDPPPRPIQSHPRLIDKPDNSSRLTMATRTCDTAPNPTALSSWNIYHQNYQLHKMNRTDYGQLSTRITENANELRRNEERIREIGLKRDIAKAKIVDSIKSTLPRLTLNSCVDRRGIFTAFKDYDLKYFSPKPERPELNSDMIMTIDDASKPHPPNEVLSEIDGVQILRKDIKTLVGINWLNDEIVNAYMHLLVMRGQQKGYKKVYAFNTFFYPKVRENGYSSVRRWTRKVDIFSYNFLLVPVHLGNHWCLGIVDFDQRTISYYDSLGGGPNGCCDTLLEYLREESMDKKKQDFDDENWRLINRFASDGIPMQMNGSDCGVFCCQYAEYITRGAKLNFSQEHMRYFRKKMIYEIISRRIIE